MWSLLSNSNGVLMTLGQIEIYIYIFLPNGSWDGYRVWEQETVRICISWACAEFTLHDCGGFCRWSTGAASQHTDLERCILLGRAAPLVIRRFFVFLPLPLSRAAAAERSMCVCKTRTFMINLIWLKALQRWLLHFPCSLKNVSWYIGRASHSLDGWWSSVKEDLFLRQNHVFKDVLGQESVGPRLLYRKFGLALWF